MKNRVKLFSRNKNNSLKKFSLERYRATIGNIKFVGHWKYKYKKLFSDRIVNISDRHNMNIY